MMHPCILVRSIWDFYDGVAVGSECFFCRETKLGARRIVNTRSGTTMYLFLCHDCEDFRRSCR